jgi:hypothetical protein
MLVTLTPDERALLCTTITHTMRRLPAMELAMYSTFLTQPDRRCVELERLRNVNYRLAALLNKLDPDGECLRPDETLTDHPHGGE